MEALLFFGVERKGAPVFDTYWRYPGPILCCASDFPRSFGHVFSDPQLLRLHAEGL